MCWTNAEWHWFLLASLALYQPALCTLTCSHCTDIKADDTLLSKLVGTASSKYCHEISSDTPKIECPDDDNEYMCAAFNGKITSEIGSLFSVGKVEIAVVKRGCAAVEDASLFNDCRDIDDKKDKGFLASVLKIIGDDGESAKFDGHVCLCGTSNCDPNCSGLALGSTCMHYALVAFLGLLIFIVVFAVISAIVGAILKFGRCKDRKSLKN